MRRAFVRRAIGWISALWVLGVAACHGEGVPRVPRRGLPRVVAGEAPFRDETTTHGDAGNAVAAITPEGGAVSRASEDEPVLLVTDPATLIELESHGGGFGAVAFGARTESLQALARDPVYRSLARQIAADVAEERTRDPKSGVGMRYAHRLFDARWLESSDTRFELVGVVNRLDRHAFHPATCGETRFVYRLAYRSDRGGHSISSRLPMTVNVVFWQHPDADGSCRTSTRRWLAAGAEPGAALADRLRGDEGPLHPTRLGADRLKAIEINVQRVRWPSTVRPDMAGYTEYLLRVFHLDAKEHRLVAAPLENTPDVAALRQDRRRRAALLAWLRRDETLRAIDSGIAVMPDEFATTRSVSVTPHGLARRANRPFARLFGASDFAGIDLGRYKLVRSADSLLRRLDEMSCSGCHQTRSLAGFHLLGEERDPSRQIDTLLVSTSPHLEGELDRRRAHARAMLEGKTPDDARPFADHDRTSGSYGSHCGLGDPAYAEWRCEEGLECKDVGEPAVGACLPHSPQGPGDPCEVGRVVPDNDPKLDRVAGANATSCPLLGSCFSNYRGFPGGMCALACGAGGADSECGKIAILRDFNACLARSEPFDICVRDNADPAAMRACDRSHPCRDDYICAKAASRGVCIPPYFLFQLRVDGHLL